MLFLFFKLNKRFSDANLIREIRNDAQKLVADIAFQTDKSVTVVEAKIKEANAAMQELDRRIVLARAEDEKKLHEAEILTNLHQKAVYEPPLNRAELKAEVKPNFRTEPRTEERKIAPRNIETRKIESREIENINEEPREKESEAVKIYTKQVLLNSKNQAIVPKASMQEQIIEMARKGFSIELIAEKVPLPIGEIELIISMNV